MIEEEFISIWYVFLISAIMSPEHCTSITCGKHSNKMIKLNLFQVLIYRKHLKKIPDTICQTDYSTDSEEEYTVAAEAYCNVQG